MKTFKAIFDRIFALISLVIFAPLLVILMILVRLNLGSPIFFIQERPGKGRKVFRLVKFRSMRNANGADGNPLPDEERMTKFGSFLRSSSLDELPELWNVIRGEMSFVGPRPLLVRYLDRYSPEQDRRHEVLPGITGFAQISGRNAISWEEKFALDVWYVDNWSIGLDFKIIFMTFAKVIRREDISTDSTVTMTEFMGSAEGTS